MNQNTSRRRFLKTAGALGAASTMGFPSILSAQNPGRKLNIAAIGGGGGKGESDLANAAKDNNVVAICDVDRDRLAKALQKYPGAKGFTEFRKMLDEMKEIEAVTVSTADHAHFPAAMHAIGLGKHVCVQKPLVNRLWEAEQLYKAAKKKGVVTNMGNQGHTGEGLRVLKEWIQQGAIGKVKEIHVWTNRPIWPQGKSATYPAKDVPANLDWESWQAATKRRPFMDNLHPFKWRGHLEYGAGAMGDMGCHLMDGPFFACDLTTPTKLKAEVLEMTADAWPKGSHVVMDFVKEGVKFHWYEGKGADDKAWKPALPAGLEPGRELKEGGFIMIGEKGGIINFGDYCDQPRLFPESKHKDWLATNPKKTLARATHPGNPQEEFTHAIKNGLVCGSNFDYSVPLTELCLLGNLAMHAAGKEIEWDPAARKVVGMPEMDKHIKREFEKGWEYSADKI